MNSDWGVDEIASRGALANEERESLFQRYKLSRGVSVSLTLLLPCPSFRCIVLRLAF